MMSCVVSKHQRLFIQVRPQCCSTRLVLVTMDKREQRREKRGVEERPVRREKKQ